MGHPVLWNDYLPFVDCLLQLNVEWSDDGTQDLLSFVEWQDKSKTSDDIVSDQGQKEFFLLACALVVSKG